jgi:hypothetical protein
MSLSMGSTGDDVKQLQMATPANQQKLLKRLPSVPDWQTWQAPRPLLSFPNQAGFFWDMQFTGAESRPVTTFAYECDPQLKTKHLGIAMPVDCNLPTAYLIYFHHHNLGGYHPSDFLFKGIGDYLVGRIDIKRQLSQSGKSVVAIVPEPAVGSTCGIFATNETLIQKAIQEIDEDITGVKRPMPPLLLAAYSSSIAELQTFWKHCRNLRGQVKAIYDFDGAALGAFRGFTMHDWATSFSTQVFRYEGATGPQPSKKQLQSPTGFGISELDMFVINNVSKVPSIIPVPIQRWKNHPEANTGTFTTNPMGWIHNIVPSCMLAHGLTMTSGI